MAYEAAAQAQIEGGRVRTAVFFRMETLSGSITRVWSGFGDFPVPADAVEAAEAIYQGMGVLLPLPTMQQLLGGSAERVSFSLSGVSEEIAALADTEANEVRQATILVGLMFLDEAWQQLSAMRWVSEYEVDSLGGTWDGQTFTVSLSAGSATTGRRRPLLTYFTDVDQRARSPDDRFCERTSQYDAGTSIQFGPTGS